MLLHQVLAALYSANGVLVSLVYLPQIRAAWIDKTGTQAGSLLTWSLFAVSSGVTVLYGWLVVHSGPMVLAGATSAAGSLSVLGASVYRRRQAGSW